MTYLRNGSIVLVLLGGILGIAGMNAAKAEGDAVRLQTIVEGCALIAETSAESPENCLPGAYAFETKIPEVYGMHIVYPNKNRTGVKVDTWYGQFNSLAEKANGFRDGFENGLGIEK